MNLLNNISLSVGVLITLIALAKLIESIVLKMMVRGVKHNLEM